jgi:hypothetical protein
MYDSAEVLVMANDRLSRRERTLYKVLHGVGLAWAATGFYWYIIGKHSAPGYMEAIVFASLCVLVPIFGYALRTDTRIIYGVRWLREDR